VTFRRIALIVLAIGLMASLYVAVRREHREAATRNVEIVMDDADFSAAAAAYGIDEASFLTALRKAGLTSLAVSEELGTAIGTNGNAAAYAGSTLLAQSRLAPLTDPLFATLARTHALRADTMYLIAYDAATARRYATQLPLHFPPATIRVLRRTMPEVWAVRTSANYFDGEGFGLPDDRVALAQREHLLLVPRLQNDEDFTPATLRAVINAAVAGRKARTAIFFGVANEVLGYPTHFDAAAYALSMAHLNFGSVESYDPKQVQLGNADLARKMPDRIVRVITIAKPEQDKLRPEEIVARYLLGINERNIRVVYVHPWLHSWNGRSIEASNVEIVRRVAVGILTDHKRIASASAFSEIVKNPLIVAAASLGVPGAVLLLLDLLGLGAGWPWSAALVLADLLLIAAGDLSHHDLLVRQALAFVAGIVFPALGTLAVGWAFRGDGPPVAPAAGVYVRGVLALLAAVVVTLGGALTIVGLLSTPLTMTEIEQFLGVKYVLVLPAVVALGLYLGTDRFGARLDARRFVDEPVRLAQLLVGVVLIAGAALLVERSGNQSDIAPSQFELALRAHLTTILQVRPRFKEFVVAWPALMLVPALIADDRRRWGWLFVLAAGMGLGDLIDTFSHLHTPLLVSAERVVNGGVLGALIGLALIAVYRRLRVR
jgi:hypothetical protein